MGKILREEKLIPKCFLIHRMILDGAPLIAIHKARYYKRKDGLALGPGPFVTGLEYATDCKATVVGKPEKTFFTQVRKSSIALWTYMSRIIVYICKAMEIVEI